MSDSARRFATAGAVSASVAVLAGAFAAHALRSRLEPPALAAFETAARYQMYHALALFAAAWVSQQAPGPFPTWAGRLFLLGTLLFSGSLYALALTGIRPIGIITPVGGVLFLAGWASLAVAARRL